MIRVVHDIVYLRPSGTPSGHEFWAPDRSVSLVRPKDMPAYAKLRQALTECRILGRRYRPFGSVAWNLCEDQRCE